jgi:anti-sigma factor RsiW
MDCNEARPLLDANADRELSAPDARRVQEHIERCDACRWESENLRVLSGSLRKNVPYHRAPESLRTRIVVGLPGVDDAIATSASGSAAAAPRAAREAAPRQRRWSVWLERWLDTWRGPQSGLGSPGVASGSNRLVAQGGLAALILALCAVTAGVTLSLQHPAEFAPFADELVESHVRAQVSGRDIDVISTDKHTVKPWFNGRLDYSPPVEDLAASGFALEGGRLDYLAHQRVAVLVYRYRKHVIDVYVFPGAGFPEAGFPGGGYGGTDRSVDAAVRSAPAALVREGYSIAHWNAQGMTWWAITDAAPDALSGLEAALKARLESGSQRTEGG